MKKILFILSLIVLVGSAKTFAQDGTKAKKESFGWQKTYMDEAGITADVQTKIETLKEESSAKIKAIKKDDTLTEEVKKEKIKEIQKQKGQDINALLSKEQKEKIKEIKERLKKEAEAN